MAAIPFVPPLDDVRYGVAEQVSPLIRRVIARNPSKFSYRGTGTYIVGSGR
ncbi:MAG: MBL fold metallo-hydrolase, partial [Ilumatobacteraceae bacterium]